MIKSFITAFVLVFAFSFQAFSQDAADRLLGVWEPSNGKARVKIEKIGSKYLYWTGISLP